MLQFEMFGEIIPPGTFRPTSLFNPIPMLCMSMLLIYMLFEIPFVLVLVSTSNTTIRYGSEIYVQSKALKKQ